MAILSFGVFLALPAPLRQSMLLLLFGPAASAETRKRILGVSENMSKSNGFGLAPSS